MHPIYDDGKALGALDPLPNILGEMHAAAAANTV